MWDRRELVSKLYSEMEVEPAADGTITTVRLEGGVVGRYWRDPETNRWKCEWSSREGEFHATVTELEQSDPNVAARWALEEIATALAMRAQGLENEFNA